MELSRKWKKRDGSSTKFRKNGSTIEIILPNGSLAFISAVDAHLIDEWRWWREIDRHVRVARNKKDGTREDVQLHVLIMQTKKLGHEIDHINMNGLDNRRENLRLLTRSENCINRINKRSIHKIKSSNVHRCVRPPEGRPWRAQIKWRKKLRHLGYYSTELDAAQAVTKYKELIFEFASIHA